MARAPAHEQPARQSRARPFGLLLLLYLATLSVDAIRKLTGLPVGISGIVYVLAAVIYLFLLPRMRGSGRVAPRSFPVWLVLLSLWCIAEAISQRIPIAMALLGLASYVFFVPLFYVGAGLMAADHQAAKALRVVAIAGGVIGLGAITSALLGQSAPALLQPIIPSVGFHTFNQGNIYLAPSIFATAEEAAEQLLIALFAWFALAQLPSGRLGRASSAIAGVLIAVGLFATARRADIVVAVTGIVALFFLGFLRPSSSAGPLTPRGARTRGRLGPVLILAAAGSIALLSFLGASNLVPFLTSRSAGNSAFTLMFSTSHVGGLGGQGTGTSTQGVSLVGATPFTGVNSQGTYLDYVLGGRTFATAEGGLTKTWLELGIVGVVLYGGVFLSVLAPAIRSLRRLDGVGRALTVLTITLGIIFLKGHQSLDNPLVQPLFWLSAGGVWGRMHARREPGHGDAREKFTAVTASNDPQRPLAWPHEG